VVAPGTGGTGPSSATGGAGPGGNGARGGGGAAGAGAKGGAAGNPAGAGACTTTSALLCDDFESYPVGQVPGGPWTASINQGTVVVDTTRAWSGTHAVRVTVAGGTGTYRRAFLSTMGPPVFPLPGNAFYGRMMIWLNAAPAGSVHWTNIQAEGPVPGMNFRALSRYGGQLQKRLMASYDTQGVASDCWRHSATLMPEARWACMEWRFNGPNNETDFWLDGTALTDLTVIKRGDGCLDNGTNGDWLAPTYDTLLLGWEHYQQSIVHDMWIDDVGVSLQRLGCPAANPPTK